MLTFQIFVYLQILDLLTTIIGLRLGLGEMSPFIRGVIFFGPAIAVLLSKVVAFGLAGLCVALKRRALIRRINYGYAALAVWNLGLILMASGNHRLA
jgi:hypothetical protein